VHLLALSTVVCALALVGCGGSRHVQISVISQSQQEPVISAVVSLPGTDVHATTNVGGVVSLTGLSPGIHKLDVSAPGYYLKDTSIDISKGNNAVVQLAYRPPLGKYVWNIGPDGMYWDIGTVTKSSVNATEYDWGCTLDAATGKLVGGWSPFSGALPYATALNTMAPEWVKAPKWAYHGKPPAPALGCKTPTKSTGAMLPPMFTAPTSK
jgi:hypothetical protein